VADLPFGSYEASDETAVRTAQRFVKDSGADAVKLERAGTSVDRARAVIQAGIPVMGHVGLTPQAATSLGGYRVQGRTADQAEQLIQGRSRPPSGRMLRRRPGDRTGSRHRAARPPDDMRGHRHRSRLLLWQALGDSIDESENPQAERLVHAIEDIRRRQEAGELTSDFDPEVFLIVLWAAAMAPPVEPPGSPGSTR